MKTTHNLELDDCNTLQEVEKYIGEGDFCGEDILNLWKENQLLKNKGEVKDYPIYDEDGDNNLCALSSLILINPYYLQGLLELLWSNTLYLDLVLEQDFYKWSEDQAVAATMSVEGAKVLLKNFENETSGGCN